MCYTPIRPTTGDIVAGSGISNLRSACTPQKDSWSKQQNLHVKFVKFCVVYNKMLVLTTFLPDCQKNEGSHPCPVHATS